MKRVLSIIAICLAAMMMLSLVGCSKNADTDPTAATEATKATETTAATTAPTTAPTEKADNADTNTSVNSDTADADTDWYNSEETQRSMAQQKVVQRAKELYGAGDWRVVSTEKSTDTSGLPCWYVGVVNYSNSQSPTYYFYCDPEFYCYPDDSNPSDDSGNIMNDTSFAGISEPDACAKALSAMGDGNWTLVSCIQSDYEGVDAWAITLTNPDVDLTRLAFVGSDFCYFK